MSKPTVDELRVYAEENRLLAAFRRAQADLYDNAASEAVAGVTEETPTYLRLNQAVNDAADQLPERFKHLAEDI